MSLTNLTYVYRSKQAGFKLSFQMIVIMNITWLDGVLWLKVTCNDKTIGLIGWQTPFRRYWVHWISLCNADYIMPLSEKIGDLFFSWSILKFYEGLSHKSILVIQKSELNLIVICCHSCPSSKTNAKVKLRCTLFKGKCDFTMSYSARRRWWPRCTTCIWKAFDNRPFFLPHTLKT